MSGVGFEFKWKREREEPKILGHWKGSTALQVNFQNVPVKTEGRRGVETRELMRSQDGYYLRMYDY